MAEVFDLVRLDLIRVEGRTFEGVARIPIPDPESKGEVWKGAPQVRGPRRPRSGRDAAAVPPARDPGA